MNSQLFNVVCFGTENHGVDRQKTKKALAIMLGIGVEDAESLLSSNGNVIRQGVSESDAKALQSRLGRIGVRCNYRPAPQSLENLELVPIIDDENKPRASTCPECHAKIIAAKGEPARELCPSCGLVLAKFERAMQEKAEREQIRRRVLNALRVKEDEQREEAERKAQAEHRERLEEDIRKKLGRAGGSGSRTKLVGSAAGVFLIGAVSGVGVSHFFFSAKDLEPTAIPGQAASRNTPEPRSDLAKMVVAAAPDGVDPSVEMLVALDLAQSANHKKEPKEPVGRAPALVERTPKAQSELGSSKVVTASVVQPDGAIVGSRSLASHQDPNVRKPARTDADSPAYRKIGRGAEAVETLGDIALDYLRRGNHMGAAALLVEMRKRADSLPIGRERVQALAKAAYFLWASEDQRNADRLFDSGLQHADRLSRGADRGLALAYLGASAARGGQADRGYELLREANHELLTIRDPYVRLHALCELSESYASAGQRGGALGLLDFVGNSIGMLTDPARRSATYVRLAHAHARIEDLGGALAVIAQVNDPDQREAALFDAAVESTSSGHVIWGSELAGRIQFPWYAAKAFALLGEVHSAQPGSQDEASLAFSKAESWSKLVKEPTEKLRVLGQMGQAYVLGGKNDKAAPLLERALQMAQALENQRERDQAISALTNDQLEVLLMDQAQATAALISDPTLKSDIQRNIEDARRIAMILRPGSA